jgi:hypothetical protein
MASSTLAGAAEQQPIVREDEELTARVESVDAKSRSLVLADSGGQKWDFTVDPAVRNLEQLKAGDRVKLHYHIGLAAEIKPKGTAPHAAQEQVNAKRAAPGQKPGGEVSHSVSATATIESVDTSFNTVTFKRADGTTRTVGVESPKGQEFIRKLKSGDVVEITYSEAVAVSVEPGHS